MTLDEFRQLALALPNVRLVNQLGNLSLMVGDRTLATLGAPDPNIAVLRLAPNEQVEAIKRAPEVFCPQAGGAGLRGHTCVRLEHATREIVLPLVKAAARHAGRAHSPPHRR
jgi:hypothetical protein